MINNFDKYEFARDILLGNAKSLEDKAIKSAYTSVQRTFRYEHQPHKAAKKKAYNAINSFISQINILIEKLNKMDDNYNLSIQVTYDKEFSNTCNKILKIFNDNNIACYYGQAQKWINITMKYLVLFDTKYNKLTPYFHVAIDNVVYKLVSNIFNINRPITAWSRMNEIEYWNYQSAIRYAIYTKYKRELSPFDWEWRNWNVSHRVMELENGR